MKSRSTARWLAIVALAWAPALAAQIASCERHADIRDEPDASVLKPPPVIDSGDIPTLDSGLGSGAFPACEERPVGPCEGPIDFPCDFEDWAAEVAVSCQQKTGCATNGWLEVEMSGGGCVVAIGMTHPNDAIVACLVAEYGGFRCPCGESVYTHFFGLENTGACP